MQLQLRTTDREQGSHSASVGFSEERNQDNCGKQGSVTNGMVGMNQL